MNILLSDLWYEIERTDLKTYLAMRAVCKTFYNIPGGIMLFTTIHVENGTTTYVLSDGRIHREDNDLPAVVDANGDQHWYKFGHKHRDNDKPAMIENAGGIAWYYRGNLHRDGDKPAAMWSDNYKSWFRHGVYWREDDLPTVESNGTKMWLVGSSIKPILHRETGPAKIFLNGTRVWFKNGELHREDGPALEASNGTQVWYINGYTHRVRWTCN